MEEVIEEYHINDWEECEYCKCVYWEHDTGYGEYDCQIVKNGVLEKLETTKVFDINDKFKRFNEM